MMVKIFSMVFSLLSLWALAAGAILVGLWAGLIAWMCWWLGPAIQQWWQEQQSPGPE
jgi:hypothetical protein